jgi:hypothetical protein
LFKIEIKALLFLPVHIHSCNSLLDFLGQEYNLYQFNERKGEIFLPTKNMELVFSNVAGAGLHAEAWFLPSGLEAR